MKKAWVPGALIVGFVIGWLAGSVHGDNSWRGVDETVVEEFAREAGRQARPFLDTDRGDLLLFLFLTAGSLGGFLGGYCFREIFRPEKTKET